MAYIKSRKHGQPTPTTLTRGNLIGAAVLASLTLPAGAQTEGTAAQSTLPTVVVQDSAFKADNAANSKFTAPLVDTPKSVTVITKEVLEQTNANSLQDALRTVPGITFGQGEGGTPTGDRPFIRGYDAQTSVYIDGLRDPGSQSRDIFNIEQLDITKGADSTAGGSGSTGGSLNMATKQATLGNTGSVGLGLGTAHYRRVTADLNQQVGETSAVRVNAMREHSGVAGRDAVFDDKEGAALSFNTGLDTDTVIGLDLYTFKSDGLPDFGIPFKIAGNAGTANADKGLNSGSTERGTVIKTKRSNFYGLKDRDFRQTGQDSTTLRFEHRFDEQLTLRNRTRYTSSYNRYIVTNPGDSKGWFDADPTPNDLSDTAPQNNATGEYLLRSSKNRNVKTTGWINQTEAAGEFFLGGLRNNYVAGVEISSTELNNRGYTVTDKSYAHIANPNPNDQWNGTVARKVDGTKTETDVQAVYVFNTLTITDQWLANLGLRFDRFETHQTPYNSNGAALTAAQLANDVKSTSEIFNYQAGLVFKPAANGSVYLSYATAATPSGFASGDSTESAVAVTNKDLDPETTRSLELGTKWDLLGGRLALTAAVFDMEKTNVKATNANGDVATIGTQAIKGYELGVTGSITSAWSVSAGYTHLNSKLVDAGYACSVSVPNGSTCAAQGGTFVTSPNNGKQFVNTPENSFTLWTSYTVLPGLQVGGGAYYQDKVYADAANTLWLPSYTRYDAMASYQVRKNFTLRLNVNNLSDEVYYEKPQSPHMAYVAPGRQYILTGTMTF
jgi:catecholate siderophore receptor